MNAAAQSVSRRALGRFNPFGLLVETQADIMQSHTPTSGHLVVHEPFTLEARNQLVSMVAYEAHDAARQAVVVPEGMYSLRIQCVIHHEDRIAGFVLDNTLMSFTDAVNYHPIRLIEDMRHHLLREIAASLGTPASLHCIKAPHLVPVVLHGDAPDGLIYGHLHQDEVNQTLTVTVPLLLRGAVPDTCELKRVTLNFKEDIAWLRDNVTISPEFRSYLVDCDSESLVDDADLL